MDRKDACFVVSEIRFLPYYNAKIKETEQQIKDIETEIDDLGRPRSIAYDHNDAGKTSVKKNKNIERDIAGYITTQQELEMRLNEWRRRYNSAIALKNKLLKSSESDYVTDFFDGMSYTALQDKYCYSNAYDHICRLIISELSSAWD